jgi:hypothetical protein
MSILVAVVVAIVVVVVGRIEIHSHYGWRRSRAAIEDKAPPPADEGTSSPSSWSMFGPWLGTNGRPPHEMSPLTYLVLIHVLWYE